MRGAAAWLASRPAPQSQPVRRPASPSPRALFRHMSEDLCFLSAVELRARVSRKEVSPVEVTHATLARAEQLQGKLNCFITLCGDEAMAAARVAERKLMAGEPLG